MPHIRLVDEGSGPLVHSATRIPPSFRVSGEPCTHVVDGAEDGLKRVLLGWDRQGAATNSVPIIGDTYRLEVSESVDTETVPLRAAPLNGSTQNGPSCMNVSFFFFFLKYDTNNSQS